MTPDFALSLSFSGIALLQRASSVGGPSHGWYSLGDVPLDVEDLGGALGVLREEAVASADMDGPEVKLVLPNEQVKYISVPLAGDDPLAQVHGVLQGATPYEVEDLVFDWRASEGELQVAAVAKETLAEAEHFAQDNRFVPLCFVSAPPEGAFDGEPHFGTTQVALTHLAPGVSVRPDAEPIKVLLEARPVPVPLVVETPAPIVEQPVTAAPDPAPEVTAPATAFASKRRAPEPIAPVPEPAAASTAATPEPAMAGAAPTLPSPKDMPDAVKPLDAPAGSDASTKVAFASLRANREELLAEPVQSAVTLDPLAEGTSPRIDAPTIDLPIEPNLTAPQDASSVADDGELLQATAPSAVAAEPEAPTHDNAATSEAQVSGVLARAQSGLGRTVAFVSRREGTPPPARSEAPAVSPTVNAGPEGGTAAALTGGNKMDEAERMTVFGARKGSKGRPVGGKPRFLGIMLTALLLLFLLGVAAWAAVFVDEGMARFLPERGDQVQRDSALNTPVAPDYGLTEEDIAALEESNDLNFGLSAPDANAADPETLTTGLPVLDGDAPDITEHGLNLPITTAPLTEEEAAARYVASGIWQRAPMAPVDLQQGVLDDLYVTSIDRNVVQQDAVALPRASVLLNDAAYADPGLPPRADERFSFDDSGLIRPTPEGVETPAGYTVVLGRPDIVPPNRRRPAVFVPFEEATGTAPLVADPSLRGLRPALRPSNLVENTERAQNGGLSVAEFAQIRPRTRPEAIVLASLAPEQTSVDAAVASALATDEGAGSGEDVTAPASPLAVASVRAPRARPSNLASRYRQQQQTTPPERVAAAVKPRTVKPVAPSRPTVAKAATQTNAINLRKVNLLGVSGKPSDRQALVRLANGRIQKVKVGDRIDGGRVLAISDRQLRYQKSGRNVTLDMPQG